MVQGFLFILLLLGMNLVVSGFHATLLLKSSNRNYCSSRGRNSDGRALHLNMAMNRRESIQFQEMTRRLVDLETQVKRIPDLETQVLRIPDLETQVQRIPDLETQVLRIPDLETQVQRIPDLETQVQRIPDLETQVQRIPDLETRVQRIPDLETRVQRIPDLETQVKRIPDLETQVNQIPDLKTEITTVSGEVQTLAGNRAIILASQALLIHIGVQPKINVKPSKYFSKALHNSQNPDFSMTLENVFKAADNNTKLVLTAKFDQMIDSRNLGAHPSDLGLLSAEAAKLVKILQRRVALGITLDTDEETALLVLEKYAELANAANRDKRV
jgi:hypothetical protein